MEHPEKISFYFKSEWRNLLIVTVFGLFYNIGLLAGPLFDGKLAQCLMDILNGTRRFSDMAELVLVYVAVISAVQIGRYIKRLYVRRFANNINRSMKHILYGNLIRKIYISQVFSPLESIGMEIQTIQSAFAGVRRIHEFLSRPEKWDTDSSLHFDKTAPCMEMKHVDFHYGENQTVLQDLGFTVQTGEYVTLAGCTGSGKSTIFKLLLGLYRPQNGQVLILTPGTDRKSSPDRRTP